MFSDLSWIVTIARNDSVERMCSRPSAAGWGSRDPHSMHEILGPFVGEKIGLNYWEPTNVDVAVLTFANPQYFSIKSPSGRVFTYPYASVFSLLQPPTPVKVGTSASEKAVVKLLITLNVPQISKGWVAFGISFS
jgi:hypothetical protein